MKKKTYSVTKGSITAKQQVTVNGNEVTFGDLHITSKNGKEKTQVVIPSDNADDLYEALAELGYAFVNDGTLA